MSRLAVRQAVEAELQNILGAQLPPVPFYNTVNERQRPTDELWVTCEYYSDYAEAVCFAGKSRIEHGTVDVSVFSRPGGGYVPAIRLAEVIADHFYGMDLGNGIVIQDIVPPAEGSQGDAQPLYEVIASLEYMHTL